MKRNREARGGETDQQWLFRLGVFGFDLQKELQINVTLQGKFKNPDDPEFLHPTLAWNEYVMFKDDGKKGLILKV